jgi:hypothetical protein
VSIPGLESGLARAVTIASWPANTQHTRPSTCLVSRRLLALSLPPPPCQPVSTLFAQAARRPFYEYAVQG